MSSILAILQEIEGFRAKNKVALFTQYQTELLRLQESQREAKAKHTQALIEIQERESEYSLNTTLVEITFKTLQALRNETRKNPPSVAAVNQLVTDSLETIHAVKKRGGQTWALFNKGASLNLAIQCSQHVIFKKLLDLGVDYVPSNPSHITGAEEALTLSFLPHYLQNAEQSAIYQAMCDRILRDFKQMSASGDLNWFINTINRMSINGSRALLNSPIPDEQGLTPMMQLAKDNHLLAIVKIYDDEITKYIIKHGESNGYHPIDFAKRDDSGKNIFDHAFALAHKELCLWMVDTLKVQVLSPLSIACKEGNEDLVTNLLQTPHTQDELSQGLTWAVMQGRTEITKKLLQKEINISVNDNASIVVSRYGDLDLLKLIKEKGADLSIQVCLPLSIAIIRDKEDMITYLMDQESVYESAKINRVEIQEVLSKANCQRNIAALLNKHLEESQQRAVTRIEQDFLNKYPNAKLRMKALNKQTLYPKSLCNVFKNKNEKNYFFKLFTDLRNSTCFEANQKIAEEIVAQHLTPRSQQLAIEAACRDMYKF